MCNVEPRLDAEGFSYPGREAKELPWPATASRREEVGVSHSLPVPTQGDLLQQASLVKESSPTEGLPSQEEMASLKAEPLILA